MNLGGTADEKAAAFGPAEYIAPAVSPTRSLLLSVGFSLLCACTTAPLQAITWHEWSVLHFSAQELGDPKLSGIAADPDSDGSCNLLEYIFATDPNAPDALSPVSSDLVAGQLTLTYRERNNLADAQIWLQGSDDLKHWTTYNSRLEAARIPGPDYAQVTLLDPVALDSVSCHFMRLLIVLDPPHTLAPPASLSVELISSAGVLRWTDLNTTETGYAVDQRDGMGNWRRLFVLGADTSSASIPVGETGDDFAYRIVTLGAGGQELFSPTVMFSGPDSERYVLALWDFDTAVAGATSAIVATATASGLAISSLDEQTAAMNTNANVRGVIDSLLGPTRIEGAAAAPSSYFDGHAFEIAMRATNENSSPSTSDYALNFSLEVAAGHAAEVQGLTLDFGYDTSAVSSGEGNFVRPYMQLHYSLDGICYSPLGNKIAVPISAPGAFAATKGHYIASELSVSFSESLTFSPDGGASYQALTPGTVIYFRLAFSDGGSNSDARAVFVDKIKLLGSVVMVDTAESSVCPVFATKVLAEATAIPITTQAVRILGYHEIGTGGGLYIYYGSEIPRYSPHGQVDVERPAAHYLRSQPDAFGRRGYYVLMEERPSVTQFGALADGGPDGLNAHDNTESFNAALSYGCGVTVPRGRYWIAGTLKITEDGTALSGVGPGGGNSGGSELYFGPGPGDCIQVGDGANLLRCAKIEHLLIDSRNRTRGNAIFAWLNQDLVLDDLEISSAYNGISLFRGMGFTIRNVFLNDLRAGEGSTSGPTEIGYGIKLWGAPELYEQGTGALVKRDAEVLEIESIKFSGAKLASDPTNWTVGLWCGENAATVNGRALMNRNLRYGVYLSRTAVVDPTDKLVVPDGYEVVPATRTESGVTYGYGSGQYPSRPGTVADANGPFQDLTLFYLGGEDLAGELVYNEEASGVAIQHLDLADSREGNCVYMGPSAKNMSVVGGRVGGAFAHGFEMNGEDWHIGEMQIFRHSLAEPENGAPPGTTYSAIKVGATSVGGVIAYCKIGNEPLGVDASPENTVQYGLDIAVGAKSTWYHGNRFEGCLEANVNNLAGDETQAGANYYGPVAF